MPVFLYLTTTGRVSGHSREIEIWFTERALGSTSSQSNANALTGCATSRPSRRSSSVSATGNLTALRVSSTRTASQSWQGL
jgi:hypothetical protein